MLGNCAIGSWIIATRPRIVMMIEMTIATIGRLMKNFAMMLVVLTHGEWWRAAYLTGT